MPIVFHCPEHGLVATTPRKMLKSKHGCSKCAKNSKSAAEKCVEKLLKIHKVAHVCQQKFEKCVYKNPLSYDFYIPSAKIAIECQGKQHYELVDWFGGHPQFIDQNIRDMIKKNYCLWRGITLVTIPYWEDTEEKIEKVLKKELNLY